MTCKIIGHPRPSLTHLNLEYFSYTASHGEKLLTPLSLITEPTIVSLNLGGNLRWWRSQSCFALLFEVLQNQENLKHLNLGGSEFSSEQTEELLRKITEAELFKSLVSLNLWRSANFSSDETVSLLALLLAKAPSLKQVDV